MSACACVRSICPRCSCRTCRLASTRVGGRIGDKHPCRSPGSRAQRNGPFHAAPASCSFTPRAVCTHGYNMRWCGKWYAEPQAQIQVNQGHLRWCSLSSSSATGEVPPSLPLHLAMLLSMPLKQNQRAIREKTGHSSLQQHDQDKLFLLIMKASQSKLAAP